MSSLPVYINVKSELQTKYYLSNQSQALTDFDGNLTGERKNLVNSFAIQV